jgi:predicted dehydrogenase
MAPLGHRVVVIGVGSIGERHLRCFAATGRAELMLVEVQDDLRHAVAERYAVAAALADLDAALAHGPNIAVIATPAPLHVPLATRLAEVGVHLLIEKPLGVSLDGVEHLRQAVARRRVRAAVAYVYRCHPLLAALRQAIRADRFGRPVELVAVTGQHFPTYRPGYRGIYYADRAAGGGAIQDALTHVVNAGEWLLGPVERLVADAAHQVLEGVAVEDTVHLMARHGPVPASYSLNQHQAPNEMTITVVCERGTARCEFHEQRWRWMTQPGGPWQEHALPPLERDALFVAQANAFLDAVEGRSAVPCSLEEGIQTLRVNLAALASVEQGAWQAVRPGDRV